jgi:hypothetical protein
MAAADWFAQAAVAEPVTAPARRRRPARRSAGRPAASVRSRRKPTQRSVRGHIVWMILFAILLFGVVAVNVAVLRAHVAVSKLDRERSQIENQNQLLRSRLSALDSPSRIEAAARRLDLVQATAANTSYGDMLQRGH